MTGERGAHERPSRRGARPQRVAAVGVAIAVVVTAFGGHGAHRQATATAASATATAAYVAITPRRLADTRQPDCSCTRADANTITVDVAGRVSMPPAIVAAAVTITAPPAPAGFVTVYPDGAERPVASTLNTRADRVVANSTIVRLGANGRLALYHSSGGDVIVDVTGVFVAATSARAGRFMPVVPRRLIDTRPPHSSIGALPPDGELTVPLPNDIAGDAAALVVNVTNVEASAPGFVSGRPAGTVPNDTSFLNPDGSGKAVAGTVILPASPTGITLRSLSGGHLIVDLVGWFSGPSASEGSDGLFVPIGPQRLLDTRNEHPRIYAAGTRELSTAAYPGYAALVTNVTVTLPDRVGFVTAYPAGTPRPPTSTINPAMFEHTVANLAITTVSDRGIAYYSHAPTDLVVDITGAFSGTPATASLPPPPNAPTLARVLIVGDSTLATIPLFTTSQTAFVGFVPIVDADNCRRLLRPSCRSPVTGRIPNTIYEAILAAPAPIDVVVIRGGYNDWFSDFPREFDAVVQASRTVGAHTVLWMSYTYALETRPEAQRAYIENNIDLFRLVTLPQYSDVMVADWDRYTRSAPRSWTWDGAHLTEYGTWLFTDYISRWIAALEHRPCPRPWGPGGTSFDPCPRPELIGAVPNVVALY